MRDLSTNYMGLKLKNPLLVSSSGLSGSVAKIERLAAAGVGAIVLKSLFEEQINHEVNQEIQNSGNLGYPEAIDYLKGYVHQHKLADYLSLIKGAKAKVDVPIIASINCYSANEWVDFAKQIESAGADALELNVFVVNTDKNGSAEAYEQIYFDIIESVVKTISIPVAIKLGPFFSNLVSLVNRLSLSGVKGVVMFNRFYEPDVDIEALKVTSASVFSSAADIKNTLRWVSIVSAKVPAVHISATTGIHNAEGAIKQLLVGATTVQVCSAVYKSGPTIIRKMLEDIDFWMAGKGFSKIGDFRAALNYSSVPDPQLYERAQFMKYFSSLE
jgi:dihydroorotate dehydrogenase (fumarate)